MCYFLYSNIITNFLFLLSCNFDHINKWVSDKEIAKFDNARKYKLYVIYSLMVAKQCQMKL